MHLHNITNDILDEEGGYWDDPIGGATNFGITQRTLDSLRPKHASLPLSVVDLEKEQAAVIIEEHYLRAQNVHLLPEPLATVIGHTVVMSWDDGVRILQQKIGATPDGVIGSKTLAKVRSIPSYSLITLAWRVAMEFVATRQNQFRASYANRFEKVLLRVL